MRARGRAAGCGCRAGRAQGKDRPFLGGSRGLEPTDPDRWWGETPLSLAISELEAPDSAPLVIDDLAAHQLLAADPLHQEHRYRGLIAVPLRPGSSNFGAVCALSRHPRPWSDRDATCLRGAHGGRPPVLDSRQRRPGDQRRRAGVRPRRDDRPHCAPGGRARAGTQAPGARSEGERARRARLLAEIQRLARIGSWEWDIATDTITWSDELHRIFGSNPERFDPSFEAYLARLPEPDRERVQRMIEDALDERRRYCQLKPGLARLRG